MAINNTLDNCRFNNFLDLTNEEVAQEYLFTPLEDIFFSAVLPTVLFICLIANFAFIYTVIRVPSMGTVTNTYLSHVAAADVIFVTLSVTIYCHAYFQTPVHSVLMTYFVSLFLITFVTIERYYAICRPLQHRIVAGKSRTNKIIVASWMMGVFFGACVAPRYSGFVTFCVQWPDSEEFHNLPETIYHCVEVHPDVYLFSEITQTAPLFLAMVANIFMYSSIIKALSQRPTSTNNSDDATNAAQQQQSQRVRNQVARLLIINGTLFFLCQAPFRIVSIHNMMVHHGRSGLFKSEQYGAMLVIGRCLVLINSCVNPFVYVTTSSFYREAFFKAFRCGSANSNHSCSSLSDKTQSIYVKQ
ncbi:neuropeptides capa receptor-like [Amphiura filiformis]|uniref:neuropeptides capa receptor-like n=1 Tax=Amphiura filiformis TaxID=82378 RepID=UPI003B21A80B